MSKYFRLTKEEAYEIIEQMKEHGKISPTLLMRKLRINSAKASWIHNEITTLDKLKQNTMEAINV